MASRLRGWLGGLEQAPAFVTLAVVLVAPQLIGGVPLAARIVLAALALLALGGLLATRTARTQPLRFGTLGLVLAGLTLWTFAQWVPLPAGLSQALAPATAAARAATEQAWGAAEGPAWTALSLDPARTGAQVVTLIGLLAVFLLVANARPSPGDIPRRVAFAIELSALALVAAGVLHEALGMRTVFGVYEPTRAAAGLTPLMTPILNPNHAAALCLLGLAASVGLALDAGAGIRRRLHVLASAALLAAIAVTGSRANLVLAPVLVVGLAFLALRREEDERVRRGGWALTGGVVVGAGALIAVGLWKGWIAWPGAEGGWGELFAGLDLDKRWRVGLAVAEQQPWVGVGAGAFVAAAAGVMGRWEGGLVDHAHNGLLQAAADWGLPVAAAALLVGGAAFVSSLWLVRKEVVPLALGLGLGALLLQNLVDFSLWIPGVGFAAAAAAGAVTQAAMQRSPRRGLRKRLVRTGKTGQRALVVAALVGAAVVAGHHAWAEDPARWQRDMRQALAEGKPGSIELDRLLAEHPSDFYLIRLGASVARMGGRAEAGRRLADRALALAPSNEGALRTRAEIALGEGDVPTALTCLGGMFAESAWGRRVASELVLKHGRLPGLHEGWFGGAPERVVVAARRLEGNGRRPAARALLAWGTERFPDDLALHEARVQALLAGPPAREVLDKLSLALLTKGSDETRGEEGLRWQRLGYLVQGHVLASEQRPAEARHMFQAAARLDVLAAGEPLVMEARMLLETGDGEALERVLGQVDVATRDAGALRADYHRLRSQQAEQRGDLRGAIRELNRAMVFVKDDAADARRLAKLYDQAGDRRAAANTRARLETP